MQRDKRGRFIKKAQDGLKLEGTTIFLNGRRYKVNQGSYQKFLDANIPNMDFQTWLKSDYSNGALTLLEDNADPLPGQPSISTPTTAPSNSLNTPAATTEVSKNTTTPYTPYKTNFTGFNIPGMDLGVQPFKAEPLKLDLDDPFGLKRQKDALTMWDQAGLPEDSILAPTKIKYDATKDGRFVTADGKELGIFDVVNNKDKYELNTSDTLLNGEPRKTPEGEKSAGINLKEIGDPIGDALKNSAKTINKGKLADFLELTRAGIGASVNNKVAQRALDAEKPFLQDVSESHRAVYGDYRAQIQGEKAAAQLRNMASKPLTSDGALQSQMMMDAQIKGQQYIDQGNAQDEAMIKQTREVAWQQEKENQQQRQAAAMQNRQAMLMSEKNKANILNMRDSANFSQVVSPLLAGKEQRLRNKAAQQEYYQDYYDDATVTQDVWSNFNDGLSESQKVLRDKYINEGAEALATYINEDKVTRNSDWTQLKQIMNNEIIRRKALIKGAIVNSSALPKTNSLNGNMWFNPSNNMFVHKQGGTIYKARLSKRTKDNDRGAKSIESSKKIAARFLEKAIDSLYDYNDVELIAKPKKKKRKYQAGGGLPFVSFTPVFATSETGAPKATAETKSKKEDKDDLTSKDVLQLLKDMDGLPSDMALIVDSLKNFELQDQMDPLGLASSSNIASRYISLINKIKVAKFNREEYNNAFNQLKGNGGLNELAVTSEGLLIGTNKDGDFKYFSPDAVNNKEHAKEGYSLLTNSNLLYMRANSTDAAFNHRLTTQAQNGIGMEVITENINKIIQGLGSSKESEEGFVKMGSKGQIKEGLKYLQKVAAEVGDNSINQNMSIADYYQAGYLTEDQAQQAEIALQYIFRALPENAKSLLKVKGGSDKGAEAIVRSLVTSRTSTDVQFKATPKKMTKSSSSSGESDGVDKLKLSPVQMMQVGYTDHQAVTIQKGTKYAMQVNAQVLPITDVNKKLLGVTTLDKVAESTFGGALDMNNVTMGNQLIDPQALQNVQIDSTNLYVMNLPIDRSSVDGTIKPDLSWMQKIEAIDQTIRQQGITDINKINALYQEAGLPVLMDSNGQLNTRDYCKFGVLNGHALNSAFKDLDLLDNTVNEIDDEDQINNILSILNKDRNEKDRIDFDSESWMDSIFGTDHDSIYEGTIYIPVRTNAFTGMIGGGQYPDTETAAEVEALVQQKERTRGYVDPGLLIN